MSPDDEPSMDLVLMTLQRVEGKVDDALKRLGTCWNDESGLLKGTGLAGDFARLEKRVDERFRRDDNLYLSWRNRVAGAMAATTLLGGAIWWGIKTWLESMK